MPWLGLAAGDVGELARESGDAVGAAACSRAVPARECSQPERRFLERKLRELDFSAC